MSEELSKAKITFKKRSSKNANIRKKEVDNNSNEDSTDNGDDSAQIIDTGNLTDIKLLQQLRQRKTGVSINKLNNKESNDNKNNTITNNSNNKDINTLISNQFSSGLNYNIDEEEIFKHKSIMDQFINEKLGINNNNTNKDDKNISKSVDDELYKVPDYIKSLGEINDTKKIIDNDNGVASQWSTGIAEVNLPAKFKLKNIEETEKLTKSFNKSNNNSEIASSAIPVADRSGKVPVGVHAAAVPVTTMPYSRFQIPNHANAKRYRDDLFGELGDTEDINPSKKPQHSSDQYVKEQFCKHQTNRFR